MVRVVASSVRGPAHQRDGLPCQDAWLAVPSDHACFAVVCDGMGSRPRGRDGARAATRAARDAWRAWCRSPVGSVDDLVRLLEVFWRLRLGPLRPEDCATTCLLYGEDGHGRAAVAQLGDGLIARMSANAEVSVHPSKAVGFGLTDALGCPHTLAHWSLALGAPLEPGEALLLATDGVSEDLEFSRLGDLVSWVTGDLALHSQPWRRLASELRRWPVPHHQDDKTLLVMWKP